MAKVPLRVYNHEIEGMIEGGQLNESIAHCQHILKSYSMFIDTYRLLGKAFLESRRYVDAADIFSRILMAVPDDFVSHVGMSIIRDDENKLDDAIWHMERAFEVQPSNPAIQGELRRLYGRRDGVEPPKIRLSRDALANMYSQGDLFNQAIAEIRAVLADDPNRPDLQVMLARAYFRAGQKMEATEMAAGLLKKYPYSLDALRILVEVLPETTKADNVQVYRQRLLMLDPYAAFATGSVFQSDQVPDAAVSLEHLEYRSDAPAPSSQPNWAASLGIKLDTDKKGEPAPEWLAGAQPAEEQLVTFEPMPADSAPAAPAVLPPIETQQAVESPAPAPAAAEDGSIPDWMRSAGWQESNGQVPETPLENPGGAPAPAPAEANSAADIPDWLKSMKPPEAAGVESPAAPAGDFGQDAPDWLKGLTPAGETASSPVPAAPSAESGADTPDWLKGMKPAGESAPAAAQPPVSSPEPPAEAAVPPDLGSTQPVNPFAGNTPPSEQEQDAALAWLEGLAAKQGVKEEELLTKPADRSEKMPDWIRSAAADQASPAVKEPPTIPQPGGPTGASPQDVASIAAEAAASIEAQPAPLASPSEGSSKPLNIEDDTMAWLESLAVKQGAKPEELLTRPEDRSDTPPAWVQKAAESPLEPHAAGPAQPAEQAPVEPSADIPEAPRAADDMTITSWLSKLDVEEALNKARGTAAPTEPPAEAETPEAVPSGPDELPSWLKDMDKPAPGSSGLASDQSMPEWLRNTNAQGPEETPSGGEPASGSELPTWVDENVPVIPSSPTAPEEWVPADKAAQPDAPLPGTPHENQSLPEASTPRRTPSSSMPAQSMVTGPLSRVPALAKDGDMLSTAQATLDANQLKEAMAVYAKLIKKGRLLEEVIHDLREATYRFPVDVIVWQTLGDAYMRANHLQEALDAYNKAEELLR